MQGGYYALYSQSGFIVDSCPVIVIITGYFLAFFHSCLYSEGTEWITIPVGVHAYNCSFLQITEFITGWHI